MSAALVAGLAGLAALDALNPATIAGVALLLLAPLARPVRAAAAFVAGAYLTVLGLGVLLYFGADAASAAVGDGLLWLRRGAFTLAAIALVVAGIQRLRTRTRAAVTVPRWVNPVTAAPLGVLMTAADLPNAFPYFVAVERLVNADLGPLPVLLALAGYALVYCLPCLLLLLAGAVRGDRVRTRLETVYQRLGAARERPRSLPVAAAYLAAGGLVFTLVVAT
ncbi:GAP family protein [Micromonospora sp. BQ11]|uniref:GAP family protein n=1 Tax=Micromonospora sp. BQ11 TaxID=3452212 RepID=UPI003F8891DE